MPSDTLVIVSFHSSKRKGLRLEIVYVGAPEPSTGCIPVLGDGQERGGGEVGHGGARQEGWLKSKTMRRQKAWEMVHLKLGGEPCGCICSEANSSS